MLDISFVLLIWILFYYNITVFHVNHLYLLLQTLKYGQTQGLPDATEFIIYGAASLKTGALSPNGDKISVGCMLKIEMNVQANAMRLTLRTVHPAATVAVMQTIKSLLL